MNVSIKKKCIKSNKRDLRPPTPFISVPVSTKKRKSPDKEISESETSESETSESETSESETSEVEVSKAEKALEKKLKEGKIKDKVEENPTKKRKIEISDTTVFSKNNINYQSRLKDDWTCPLLTVPDIDNDLKIVDKITTKYIVTIPYCFSGIPAYCNHWNKQFSSDLIDNIDNLKLNKKLFVKHWDLFPIFFIFPNKNGKNIYSSDVTLFTKDIEFEKDDIKVYLNPKLTMVLKPVSQKFIGIAQKSKADNLKFKYSVMQNIPLATHFDDQINIYKNKNILNSNKAWVLHLILNEKKASFTGCNINFYKNKEIFPFSSTKLYQSLYLYYSKEI